MPVFNGDKYIREAIDSALRQTFSDFELIISDNSSTDGTADICREYAARDSRIRYYRQTQNIGAHRNFLFVLDQARGEHFMWLAHDDFYGSRDYIETLYRKSREGFVLVFPNYITLRDGLELPSDPALARMLSLVVTRYELNKVILTCSQMSHQFYGMFKRDIMPELRSVFATDMDLRCFNEGKLLHWMFSRYRCAYEGGTSLVYRVHAGNSSRTTPATVLLVDFLKYTWRVIKVYLCSSYSIWQKVRLLAAIFVAHGRYTVLLGLATVKHFVRRLLGAFAR